MMSSDRAVPTDDDIERAAAEAEAAKKRLVKMKKERAWLDKNRVTIQSRAFEMLRDGIAHDCADAFERACIELREKHDAQTSKAREARAKQPEHDGNETLPATETGDEAQNVSVERVA